MKKFVIAGIAAIAIAVLAPQSQAAPPAKHSTPAATTHSQTKAPAKTFQAKSHGAPASKFAGKSVGGADRRGGVKRADVHGRDVKVAHEDRLAHGRPVGRDDRLVRDERQRHDEELRNERLRRERLEHRE